LTEALEATLEGNAAREAGRIRVLVRDAIEQVRQLSHGLSPAAVKHRGLASSLRLLARQTSNARIKCTCQIEWEPEFKNHEVETHLFRIAQEAVTNAVKHGRPKNITISLRLVSETSGLMEIRDDGAGFQRTKSKRLEGIGIAVMRYRCGLFGGTLEISTPSNGGCSVGCRFACPL
jgi:signal transduction histidine kinase